ncbi:MAG: Dickkopf N-terminal cysteine-rich domain-containing protein [Granulosicoccus sp.]
MKNVKHIALYMCLILAGVLLYGKAHAADFSVHVKFHINTQKYDFDEMVGWLRTNIRTAESVYNNAPALKIHPSFVRENHPEIQTYFMPQDAGYSYLGFQNASELVRFMDDNFDNQARTKTEGHLTVLVVDNIVKNENKEKGLCGRATFPHWVNPFSRKLGILMAGECVKTDRYLLSHELGHFFSIKHTFESYVNLNLFSVSNCNKEFGNKIKCNSCQGRPIANKDGDLRSCDGIANIMDYCASIIGKEVLNACQLNRAAKQRKRYQTKDGETNYQAMAGLRGEGACESDSQCKPNEFCTAGIPNLARNICKPELSLGAACTTKRQCSSGRCNLGRCVEADQCQADRDCASGSYCTDPIAGQRLCKSRLSGGSVCTKDQQCQAGRCKTGFCSAKASVSMGQSCRFNDECRQGKCTAAIGGVTKGICVCNSDSQCGSQQWCDMGLDLKVNKCRAKINKGQSCGKAGSFNNDRKCKSGKCSGFPNYKCK